MPLRHRLFSNDVQPNSNRRLPFYRRDPPNLSDSSITKSPKPSLLARVVHRVVPCVAHDSAAFLPDADDTFVAAPTFKDDSHDQQQLSPTPSIHDPDIPPDGVTSSAVQPPGSTGDIVRTTDPDLLSEEDDETLIINKGGTGVPVGPDGECNPLLPPILPEHVGRKCLVLDLDETLVHSSFKAVQDADFVVPVEIEYHWHHFHVLKRPGVDEFLRRMAELYEVVVFTASLSKYADPVLDQLDIHRAVTHRLFRESCYSHKGNYVKDLSQLGRPIADTIIIDNSPASYIFHPHNAVPVSSWFNDPHDTELIDLVPVLADLTDVPDVRGVLNLSR